MALILFKGIILKKEFIKIGKITKPHGIKGEMRILPCNDEAENIKIGDKVFLDDKDEKTLLHVKSIKHIKQFIVFGFEEFDNINLIEKYRNKILYIKMEDATPLKEGQYYIDDLIDMKVIDEIGDEIGILYDVLETGANDVYEIHTKDSKEILIPAIPDCIKDVNLEKNTMTVHLLEGLE